MTEAQAFAERAESLRMIRDSAAAVVPPDGDLRRVRGLRFAAPGYDPAVLREMGAMGWIGLRVPEAEGGAGLGMAECCALAEQLGRGLVPEPVIPAMLSAALLAGAGERALLARVLAGEAYLPVAWQETADGLEAPGSVGAPRLFVPMPRGAEALLVPVREGAHLALHLVPAAAQETEVMPLQDGGEAGRLLPAFGAGQRLEGDAGPALSRALEEAALATAAYLLGVMERAFAMTLAYLRTRRQFGRPIGSFQALQHRAVDLRIQVALTRASVEAAAAMLDGLPPRPLDARRGAVSRAKARAAEAAMLVTRQAVQMHGAIGYTDEYDLGLFLRKAMVQANAFGSAALHRRRFLSVAEEDA